MPGLENYLAEGFVNHNTAKTSAAMDRLIRRGIEYPGINQLLARATLVSLKDSSIVRLRQRAGGLFSPESGGSENTNEGLFRFPKTADPVTGALVQSTINGIGLDRIDLENVFKSTEYGGGHLDEANEIPSDAHDMLQERSRQTIWHRSRVVKQMCMELAVIWSETTGAHLTWQDVHAILLADPLNKVGELQLPPDHPEPGTTTVSATWNPVGNDHTWMRYVGVPYPMPAPTEKWVEDFVGIREVYVEPKILRDDYHTLRAGALVRLPDGQRNYVAKHDAVAQRVTFVDGASAPDDKVGLIVQRYCIYAFGHENMSRDHRNVENTYLMANQEMRRRHQLGHVNVREGRVTPAFINEPLEHGGHVVPKVSLEKLMGSSARVLAGLDHGGDHPTAFVQAVYLPNINSMIVFNEYVESGYSAYKNATMIKPLLMHGLEFTVGYDPAMNARSFDKDTSRVIDNYIEVIGDNFVPGMPGPAAFDELAKRLEVQENFLSEARPVPGLLVAEDCVQVIHTLQNLEWRHVKHQRGNWMVDVGDALKLMVSIAKLGYMDLSTTLLDTTPRLAYSDKWADGSPMKGRY